jgi:hypothetical protein
MERGVAKITRVKHCERIFPDEKFSNFYFTENESDRQLSARVMARWSICEMREFW